MKNKIVMITGASAGIGEACAETFAEAGANLIIMARRKTKLNKLAEELKLKNGTETINLDCDVRSYKTLENNINSLSEQWKEIDVLINNAGLSRGLDKIQDGVLENWEEMIDTNIKGLLYVSRLVIPLMVARGTGTVINIGSLAGRDIYPAGNVYCATKHAVKALSKAMTIDLNGTGVRVTNLDPGLVETEFSLVRFRGDKERADKFYQGYKPLVGADIAKAALFCAMLPQHVCVQDMLVTPTDQATTTIINKKNV
jgi:3-hydroxy acid dehydrogenase / malonic semialdehyde reductase